MSYLIRLAKENFKFSASHFTIFGATHGERMHGHNYYVACELTIPKTSQELGLAFDFNEIKPILKQICEQLDERVLLPSLSAHLTLADDTETVPGQTSCRAEFGGKTYLFPQADVKILPVCNVTSEELARWIGTELLQQTMELRKQALIGQIAITVEETRGQSVTWTHHD